LSSIQREVTKSFGLGDVNSSNQGKEERKEVGKEEEKLNLGETLNTHSQQSAGRDNDILPNTQPELSPKPEFAVSQAKLERSRGQHHEVFP
jgi:hypothetical protein